MHVRRIDQVLLLALGVCFTASLIATGCHGISSTNEQLSTYDMSLNYGDMGDCVDGGDGGVCLFPSSLCTCDNGLASDPLGVCPDGTNCSTGTSQGLCICDDGSVSDGNGACADGTNCGEYINSLCTCDDLTPSDSMGNCDDGSNCGGLTGYLCTCGDGSHSDSLGNCADGSDCWMPGDAVCTATATRKTSPGPVAQSTTCSGGTVYCGISKPHEGTEDTGAGCVPLNCLEGCKSTLTTELCLDLQNGIEPTLDYALEQLAEKELPPGIDLLVLTAEVMNAIAENFPAIACGTISSTANTECLTNPNSAACLDETAVGICFCQWGTNNPNGQPPQPEANNLCGGGNVSHLCACLSNSLSTSSSYDPYGAMHTCRTNPNAVHSCPNGNTPAVAACANHKPRSLTDIATDCNKISNQWYTTWWGGSNYKACANVCMYNTSLNFKNCK
jgi:hypothetical protein